MLCQLSCTKYVSIMNNSYNSRNTRKGNTASSIQSQGSYTEPLECCRFLHYVQTRDHFHWSIYVYACFEEWICQYIIRVIKSCYALRSSMKLFIKFLWSGSFLQLLPVENVLHLFWNGEWEYILWDIWV